MGLDSTADWSADACSLYARVEDAGVNASATPQQLWRDGWLLRFSPGKAKRARCVHALAPGSAPLDEQIARTERFYARVGLPLIFRITPFSPPGLDAALAERGLVSIDDTRMMVCRDLGAMQRASTPPPLPPGHVIAPVGVQALAQAVGAMRGSTLAQQQAHAQRLEQSPLDWRAFVIRRQSDGRPVCAGQVAVEDDLVGVYDVVTDPACRKLGLATYLCWHTLTLIASQGQAQTAYLLVDADNVPARRIYARLGFADAYRYHYRLRPAAAAGA